jgi:hypothetical protein
VLTGRKAIPNTTNELLEMAKKIQTGSATNEDIIHFKALAANM